MRTIKFRAWDEWQWEPGMFNPLHHDYYEFDEINQRTDRFHIMQFTCLSDKNGKEIYEGDILKSDKNILFRCIYDDEEARFAFVSKNIWNDGKTSLFKSAKWVLNNCHVVGNIYENPELLNWNP